MTTTIEILGPGCPKCEKTEARVREVLAELDLDAEVEKITDQDEILARDVMMTPAVVVDGEVRVTGKVPRVSQLESILGE
ncbi:MAG: thioredoxin family protein [Halodesulfurarchaeum sp.]